MIGRLSDAAVAARFPAVEMTSDVPLYRIHREVNNPIWFCVDGDCRFDPPDGAASGFGTCYVSTSETGSYIEVFGRLRTVREEDVDARRMSRMFLAQATLLADLTDRSVLGEFGISADVQVGSDYAPSQRVAVALEAAGFGGILYAARHDPSLRTRSVAVFGRPGDGDKEMLEDATAPIPSWVISDVDRDFGLRVLPSTAPFVSGDLD